MIIDGTYSPTALKEISKCAAFAALSHAGQKRYTNSNGGPRVPYIVHPARVAGLVMQLGGEPLDVMCAWDHDIKEDCKSMDFDKFVMEDLDIPVVHKMRLITMVNALTKDDNIKDRMARLDAHIDAVIDKGGPGGILVKILDRVDNLTITPYEDNQKRIEGMNGMQFVKLYVAESEHLYNRLSQYVVDEMRDSTPSYSRPNPWGKCNVASTLLHHALDYIKGTHEALL